MIKTFQWNVNGQAYWVNGYWTKYLSYCKGCCKLASALIYIIYIKSLLACMHAGENFQSHGFMTNTAPYMQRKLFSEQDLTVSELQQRLHSQWIWARLYIWGGLHLRKFNLRKICLRKVFQGRGECKEASISSFLHTIYLFTWQRGLRLHHINKWNQFHSFSSSFEHMVIHNSNDRGVLFRCMYSGAWIRLSFLVILCQQKLIEKFREQ